MQQTRLKKNVTMCFLVLLVSHACTLQVTFNPQDLPVDLFQQSQKKIELKLFQEFLLTNNSFGHQISKGYTKELYLYPTSLETPNLLEECSIKLYESQQKGLVFLTFCKHNSDASVGLHIHLNRMAKNPAEALTFFTNGFSCLQSLARAKSEHLGTLLKLYSDLTTINKFKMMGNQDKITYQYTYRVPNQCSSEFSITFDKEAEPKLSIQTSFLPKVAISQNQKKNQKSLRNALSHLFTKLTQAN